MRTAEQMLIRVGLLLGFALGIAACSSHLDLGHDLQGHVVSPDHPDQPSMPDMMPDASVVSDAANVPDAPDDSSTPDQPTIPTAPETPTASTCVGIPCFAGPELLLASSMGNAKGLVVDADNIFWAATSGQAMMMTPKDGTETTAVPTPSPYRVAADDTNVYFTSAVGGYVAWMPKRTKPRLGPKLLPPITVILQTDTEPQSLVVASEGVYVADGQAGTITRVTTDHSAAPETLVTGLYDGAELAIDDTAVYYVDSALGEIHALSRVTNANTLLASGLEHPVAPVLRDDKLYFLELGTENASYEDGRVRRMRRSGGSIDVLMDHLEAPTGLTADTAAIYLCTRGTVRTNFKGRIVRIADDGQVSTLAVGQAEPFGIAVDGTGIYWTADSDNGLHSIAR